MPRKVLHTFKRSENMANKKMHPSNALLPARFDSTSQNLKQTCNVKLEIVYREENTPVTNNKQSLNYENNLVFKSENQNGWDSDQDTVSAFESDERTMTAGDTDPNIDSDSIPVKRRARKKRRRTCIFKIKDELVDTDEENLYTSEKLEIVHNVLSHVAMKREPSDKNNCGKIGSNTSDVHQNNESSLITAHKNSILSNKSDNSKLVAETKQLKSFNSAKMQKTSTQSNTEKSYSFSAVNVSGEAKIEEHISESSLTNKAESDAQGEIHTIDNMIFNRGPPSEHMDISEVTVQSASKSVEENNALNRKLQNTRTQSDICMTPNKSKTSDIVKKNEIVSTDSSLDMETKDEFINDVNVQMISSTMKKINTHSLKFDSTLEKTNEVMKEENISVVESPVIGSSHIKSVDASVQDKLVQNSRMSSACFSTHSDSKTKLTEDCIPKRSLDLLKYANRYIKLTAKDNSECLNYLKAKYPRKISFGPLGYSDKVEISRTHEKIENPNNQPADNKGIQNIPQIKEMIKTLISENSPEVSNEYSKVVSKVSLVFIQELNKMVQTGNISLPALCNFYPSNVCETSTLVHPPADTSKNILPRSADLREESLENGCQFISKSCTSSSDNLFSTNKSLSSDNQEEITFEKQSTMKPYNNYSKIISSNQHSRLLPSEKEYENVSLIANGEITEFGKHSIYFKNSTWDIEPKRTLCEKEIQFTQSSVGSLMSIVQGDKINSLTVPELLHSNTGNSSEGIYSNISDEEQTAILSNEELKKIIMNAAMLPNTTLCSQENELKPLNYPSQDFSYGKETKIEEKILNKYEISVSPNPNLIQMASEPDEIEILMIKAPCVSQTLNNQWYKYNSNKAIVQNRKKKNEDFCFCQNNNKSDEFNTTGATEKIRGIKINEIGNLQQVMCNDANNQNDSNKICTKNKNAGCSLDSCINSKDKAKQRNNVRCFLPNKIESNFQMPDVEIIHIKDGTKKNRNFVNFGFSEEAHMQAKSNFAEPPAKKIKATINHSVVTGIRNMVNNEKTLTVNDRNSNDKTPTQCINYSTYNPINNYSCMGKRSKSGTESHKKIKLISDNKDYFKNLPDNCIIETNKQISDCMLNSRSVSNQMATCTNLPASTVIQNPNIDSRRAFKEESSNKNIFTANAAHSKKCIDGNKSRNLSVNRNKTSALDCIAQSSKVTGCNLAKSNGNYAQVTFCGRKGSLVSSSKCLYKNVKNFMDFNDLPSLILAWNANWLLTQKETKKCAPICDGYRIVKNAYENELDYYNTYFPLHLLSIWLKISDSWKKGPTLFDSIFEDQVEKPCFVKITFSTVLSTTNFANWPKREDIILCQFIKSDGSEDNLFGRVCNVASSGYDPPENSSLHSQSSNLKKVKFEVFSSEILVIRLLATVKIQILSNIRIALLQNNALQHLNNTMKDIILDPKKHSSRLTFLPLWSHTDPTFPKCLKDIIDSVMSPTIRVTVVDTSAPCDVLFVTSQLVINLMKKHSPVLIGLKNEESFLKLAKNLKHCSNLILAVKKKEVRLPPEFHGFTLEERLAAVPGREIFKRWHVTLTLLSSAFLEDFTDGLANQNLTCIVHEAHLCTEAETTLLLHYGVKNLVLMGKNEAQTDIHPLLKRFGYNVSLFCRCCTAK